MNYYRKGVAVVALTLVGAVILHGMLLFGNLIHVSVDLPVHYRWAYQFSNSVADGHLTPAGCHLRISA
jgi:hypothetical protein